METKVTSPAGDEAAKAAKTTASTSDALGFAVAVRRIVEKHWLLLSVYPVALSYVYLAQYAAYENIPLRIHTAPASALLPWLLLNVMAVTVVLLGSMAMVTTVGSLRLKSGALLSSVIWAPATAKKPVRLAALWAWAQVVATPLLLAVVVAVVLAVYRRFDGFAAYLAFFGLPLLVGLWLTIRTLRARGIEVGALFLFQYLGMLLLGLFLFNVQVFGFGIALLQHLEARSDAAFVLGIAGYAAFCLVLLMFWFAASVRPIGRRDARRILFALLSVLTLLGLFQPSASFLARAGLALVGLGGVVVEVQTSEAPPVREWLPASLLVLDMGDEMFMRPCGSLPDKSLTHVVSRSTVRTLRTPPRGRCPAP